MLKRAITKTEMCSQAKICKEEVEKLFNELFNKYKTEILGNE